MVSLSGRAKLPECFVLNQERCVFVAKNLEQLFDDLNLGSKVPEVEYSRVFTGDVRNHLIFLVLSTSQDAAKQSRAVYNGGRKMLEQVGYDKLRERRGDMAFLSETAGKYFGPSSYNDVGRILQSGINFIEDFCKGDPVNIHAATADPDEVRTRLLNIHGIGKNISSLLIKNLVRFGYFVPENRCDIPIKMDRHALSISVANGVVEFVNPSPPRGIYRGKLERALEAAYRKACKEYEIDPIKVDDAKWSLGNELSRDKNSIIRAFSGLPFNFPVRYAQFADGSTNLNYYIGGR